MKVHKTVKLLLKSLQVQWEIQENKQVPGEADYVFSFQQGRFRLVANAHHTFVHIHFPYFSEVPLTQIDNLRFACNDFNLKQGDFKAYYTINPKEEAINTHLVFNFRLADNDKRQSYELGSMLQHTFEMSRLFRQTFHSISESGNSDLEENSALSLRERYLSSELELWHQHPKLTWRDNSTAQHTIAQLFHTFYEDESSIRFHGLQTMQTQWSKTIYDASDDATSTEIAASISSRPREIALSSHEEISNFVLLDALGDGGNVDDSAILSPVTLQVLATVGELEEKTFVIHLDVESRVENSDYVSVLFIEPTSPLSPVNSETSMAEMRKNLTHRFLMVRDHVEHEQREAEFRYQWQETQDALRRGDKLTEEQRFMGMSVVPNVGFNLYWGRRYFNAKRFYEALQHLENAYRVLNVNFEGLNKAAREHFYEVCYFIGFCYAELKLYERAYFYLDIVYPQNSVRYASEYVNLLVNTKDFRALATIERLIKNIEQEVARLEADEKEEDGLQAFFRFLQRRKGYVLIDQHKLDDAEAIFQALLDFPDSEKQAIDELMYIEQLRAEENNRKDS
ncbi:MAG: hypothetical protein HXK17_03215 [Alloprevotella sp.]|nr:hypothetical protein [Alloprevotella sp.]